MKKSDLIREVARERGVEVGAAADQMDRAVSRLIRLWIVGLAAV